MSQQIQRLWKDGDCLVVAREGAVFPPRCVWTNEPFDGATTNVKLRCSSPPRWRVNAWRGLHLERPTWMEAELALPVSESWKGGRDARIDAIGRLIRNLGLAAFLLPILILTAFGMSGMRPADWMIALVIPVPFGLIASIVGLAWPYIEIPFSRDSPVIVPRLDEQYVWLRGVPVEYLDSLPLWTGTTVADFLESNSVSRWQAIRRDHAYVILLVVLKIIALGILFAMIRGS
jgi:hypothetical protein